MNPFEPLGRVFLLTGHYGSGKTNLAVNLALDLSARGKRVVLCDLDIVNPYFRSADFAALLQERGIETINPPFAGTNLDLPVLGPGLSAALGDPGKVVIADVGGDDAGAIALGRYAGELAASGYAMLYVYNHYRYLTREPEGAKEVLDGICAASRLRAGYIVNNSNLGRETDAGVVEKALAPAAAVGALCGLPVLCTAVPRPLFPAFSGRRGFYPVDTYVRQPWEQQPPLL